MVLICSILLSVLFLLSPISVCASEVMEPEEPASMFEGYEVLGYDMEGNAVLSNEDYEEYFNQKLQERIKQIQAGEPVEEYPVAYSSYSVAPLDALGALDETKLTDKTRFISLPNWFDFALDFSKYLLNNPTMSAGETATYTSMIGSVAKKRLYYSAADLYETITLELSMMPSKPEDCELHFTRTGFGAASSWLVTTSGSGNFNMSWSASGYTVSLKNSFAFNLQIRAYSTNSLPVTTTSSTTLVSNTSSALLGSTSSIIPYAENTFYTNNSTYWSNHVLVSSSGNYWNGASILSPILSGTKITVNNYNDYSQYGYYLDEGGSLQLDPTILAAYIQNELLPQLELIYKDAYQKFPDIDADVKDEDITYIDPFPPDESETLPPDTLPGGGGMSPSELNGETFYILDMETGLPSVRLDSLPEVETFPVEVFSGAVGISNLVIDLFESSGLLPVFVSLSVLAFIVFTLKGG